MATRTAGRESVFTPALTNSVGQAANLCGEARKGVGVIGLKREIAVILDRIM